jgi:hypothetical protein
MSCTAAKVAKAKLDHPERYCLKAGCLWKVTGGGMCPRHTTMMPIATSFTGVAERTEKSREREAS